MDELRSASEVARPEEILGITPEPDYTRYRATREKPLDLGAIDPDEKGGLEKAQAVEMLSAERERINELQRRLYAEGKQSLLVVLQATDTGGKDGTIRKVLGRVNPQGCRVWSFKQPTEIELAHDFLWRVHPKAPARGMIAVFNRSHYEDVLIVRVKDLVPRKVWEPRYARINEFEYLLATQATTRILKIFLHISKEEQAERLQARLDNPDKHWKFSLGDLKERKRWNDYQAAYQAMIDRCATEYAPWYVIPADRKWYRNIVIARLVADTLEAMNPRYPDPEDDLSNVVIE